MHVTPYTLLLTPLHQHLPSDSPHWVLESSLMGPLCLLGIQEIRGGKEEEAGRQRGSKENGQGSQGGIKENSESLKEEVLAEFLAKMAKDFPWTFSKGINPCIIVDS